MVRMKRLGVVLALAVAGCGSQHRQPVPEPAAHCQTANYAMQCVTPIPPRAPQLAQPVARGWDFAWSCPNPTGRDFGISYLSYDPSKNWTADCIRWYRSAHAAIVMIWETTQARASDGYQAGRSDAVEAARQARWLGQPATRPLYFAVDYQAAGWQVADYFRGVASVVGLSRTGAYGGYWVIKGLFDSGLIRYGWQTYAWSTIGNATVWDSRAQVQQYLNTSLVDYDRATAADYGQYPYRVSPPTVDAHYGWFPTGPFPSRYGRLSERLVVERFDGARRRPVKYRVYLARTLRPELGWLAHRASYVAHRDRGWGEFVLPPQWHRNRLGWRFQQLIHRAQGHRIVP